jgi:hypothetical protein
LLLLLPILLLAACSPLRRTQRHRQVDSTAVDRTEIRKAVHDILRESGTLSQTVVEFYQPVAAPTVILPPATPPKRGKDELRPAPPDGKLDVDGGAALPPEANITEPPKPQHPPVKRIVRTEIATERERKTATDSTAHNNIRTEVQSELSDKVTEKPPAVTATIKWIAIALVAIAAIVLLLKLPKIKLPRL